MRTFRSSVVLALLVGCSQSPDARDASDRSRGRAAASSGGATSGAGSSQGTAGEAAGPTTFGGDAIAPIPVEIAGTSAAGDGAAGAAGLSGDCEIGKFCAPQEPDAINCGTLTLQQDVEVKVTPGNLLLIFDQSLSMAEGWGSTGQSKLVAAQNAIVGAITSLQDLVTVGAIFFPTYACIPGLPTGPEGAVAPIDGEGQIPFQPGPMFLQSWTNHWSNAAAGLGIGTPMQEAFDRADAAIMNAMVSGSVAVVAITDGTPTCFPDPMMSMTPTDLEVNRASNWLSTKNIKTYVVGLPGADGATVLNNVAMSGGTMQYLLPDDPATLQAKLKEVVQETIKTRFASCAINLSPAADPADKLQMVVVEAKDNMKAQVPHMLTPTAGWTISPDGMHVEITGDLCQDAMNGRFSTITFEYACKDTPPLPPIEIK